MKISLIQFSPEFGQKENNINKLIGYVNRTESDILVFPELATTGYFFQDREESAGYAEEFHGPTISVFQEMATKQDKIIVIGFVEKAGTMIFNSAAILFPEKELSTVYRKTHLFYKERFCFDPGDTGFFVINDKKRDLRLGTMICYDWRFPEAARTLGLKGADLIVCPSNLVTDVWHLAMPARALENKAYLAVANRTGTENRGGEELLFKGLSAIYGYNGSQMVVAGPDDETVISAEIYPKKTRDKSFNEFNDIVNDRRPGIYELD